MTIRIGRHVIAARWDESMSSTESERLSRLERDNPTAAIEIIRGLLKHGAVFCAVPTIELAHQVARIAREKLEHDHPEMMNVPAERRRAAVPPDDRLPFSVGATPSGSSGMAFGSNSVVVGTKPDESKESASDFGCARGTTEERATVGARICRTTFSGRHDAARAIARARNETSELAIVSVDQYASIQEAAGRLVRIPGSTMESMWFVIDSAIEGTRKDVAVDEHGRCHAPTHDYAPMGNATFGTSRIEHCSLCGWRPIRGAVGRAAAPPPLVRDPRSDPRPGDIVKMPKGTSFRLRHVVAVENQSLEGEVHPVVWFHCGRDPSMRRACRLSIWRLTCLSDTKVIHVAEPREMLTDASGRLSVGTTAVGNPVLLTEHDKERKT